MQSFRSYDPAVEYGGMVDYMIPKTFSLDNDKVDELLPDIIKALNEA
ncbi:MAG: hypothetical protein IJ123_01520 [Blautia sp.]|nr:hypothetical protein [Blautia sp.]